jgi:3-deoxy-manno-octulosonate cytidylyltransferase (CMP-KDO synthetase)
MKKVKILDCTLRDGGYYTNWNFEPKMVKDLISALDTSGIDVIELGYKSPLKGGQFRKCNDRFIWEILEYRLPINSKLAFMIDAKDFIKGDSIDFTLIDNVIHNKIDSPFSICRLAIKHSEINKSIEIANHIKNKGYDLMVNLMGISMLTDNEIEEFGKLSNINPISLYFADSYGNIEPSRVKEIVRIFKKFGCDIGIHTHDNIGLAFANCISALEEGVVWIDGTLLGMGRGVGNVKTEQIITYFQYKLNLYNSSPLHKVLSDWMIPLHNIHNWGFTHNYMISGIKHIHPLYPQILQSSFLNPNRIEDILLNIENAESYDYSKIEKTLKPKIAVVIPARYKSSRFPGKPLAKIQNKEMIIWVAEIAKNSVGIDNVYIATENEEIVDVVMGYGYKVILTSDSCLTGTDRVAEATLEIDADIIINIQGDEPLLDSTDIDKVIEAKLQYPNHIVNCMSYLNQHENVEDKKIPKVITNLDDELIYISRNPIPGTKTGNGDNPKKQVCIYAFNREHLKQFSSFGKKTPLEYNEDIEIIRFLEMGYKIKMVMLDSQSHAVDYPDDIKIVEHLLSK